MSFRGGQSGGRGGGGAGMGQGRGQGRQGRPGGRGGGRGLGPGGVCVCPSCGTTAQHQQGQPCFEMKCPKCGAMMTRN
jgi:hypothetical protein